MKMTWVGLTLCAGVLCSCGGGDAPTSPLPPVNASGLIKYQLTAINGMVLPWIYSSDASQRLMLDSATIWLTPAAQTFSDLRWVREINLMTTAGIIETEGTYSVKGDTVEFSWLDANGIPRTGVGVVNGSVMSKPEPTATLTFMK